MLPIGERTCGAALAPDPEEADPEEDEAEGDED